MESVKNDKKVNINIMMYLYLMYISYIIANDYLTYICRNKYSNITYVISGIVLIALIFFLRKKINIIKLDFGKIDSIFIMIFIVIFILRIAIPDNAFDTLNYHLMLQENPFDNYINYHFFPSKNINTFSYPLGDRMFFIFRKLLGYRLGLALNLGVIILTYNIAKEISGIILKSVIKININLKVISIISFLSVYSEKIYEIMCVYYIDILYIPLFLELLKIILLTRKDEYNKKNNIYIGVLAGIIVSLKITNILFIMPMYIVYCFRNFKSIKLKDYICLVIIPIIPIFIYTLNILIQTGSPVFPYYNKFFKSQYFDNINWIDSRFGPKNILETIFWPIIVFFKPARTTELSIYNGRISLAFVVSMVYIIYCLIKYRCSWIRLKENGKLKLVIMFVILTCIWSKFMIGYIRYALALEVVSFIIVNITIICLLSKLERRNVNFLIGVIILVCMSTNILIASKVIFVTNTEEAWRQPFYKNFNEYKSNMKYIFKDQSSGIGKNQLDYIKCWGIVDYNAGYARLLKNDIPIISLNASASNELTRKELDADINLYNDEMYTIAENDKIDEVFNELNNIGFVAYGDMIRIKPNFISNDKALYLIKIRKNDLGTTKNECITINNDKREYSVSLDKFENKNLKFSCVGGINPISQNWGSDGFNLDFYVDSNNLRQKIYTKKIKSNSNLEEISFNINLSQYGADAKLIITFSNDKDKNDNADWAAIINPNISSED